MAQSGEPREPQFPLPPELAKLQDELDEDAQKQGWPIVDYDFQRSRDDGVHFFRDGSFWRLTWTAQGQPRRDKTFTDFGDARRAMVILLGALNRAETWKLTGKAPAAIDDDEAGSAEIPESDEPDQAPTLDRVNETLMMILILILWALPYVVFGCVAYLFFLYFTSVLKR